MFTDGVCVWRGYDTLTHSCLDWLTGPIVSLTHPSEGGPAQTHTAITTQFSTNVLKYTFSQILYFPLLLWSSSIVPPPALAVMKMLYWKIEWVWNGVGGCRLGEFGWACGVGSSEFPLIVEPQAKRERESSAGWEVLGSAPIVGVSASTFSSSWVPTVGMAALPSLWPLDRGPLLACFHHPLWFILFFSF